MNRPSLTATAVAYAALGSLWRENMAVSTTVAELARRAGAGTRAARRAVRELESFGVLIPTGRLNEKGHHVGGRKASGAGYPSCWTVDLDAPSRRQNVPTIAPSKAARNAALSDAPKCGQGGTTRRTRRHETPSKAAGNAGQGGTRCRHPKEDQVGPSPPRAKTKRGGGSFIGADEETETSTPPPRRAQADAERRAAAERIVAAYPSSPDASPAADLRAVVEALEREAALPDGATPDEILLAAETYSAQRHPRGPRWLRTWARDRDYYPLVETARLAAKRAEAERQAAEGIAARSANARAAEAAQRASCDAERQAIDEAIAALDPAEYAALAAEIRRTHPGAAMAPPGGRFIRAAVASMLTDRQRPATTEADGARLDPLPTTAPPPALEPPPPIEGRTARERLAQVKARRRAEIDAAATAVAADREDALAGLSAAEYAALEAEIRRESPALAAIPPGSPLLRPAAAALARKRSAAAVAEPALPENRT
ncbi:MAG TPA: hypothetical protein PKC43_02095 [Phycisphaerales bacterium]|nr:hypothetical protein [Phycisphaerales bacterium]HMP36217.1 hypothetical protein [Phycisphaerales bacterium]